MEIAEIKGRLSVGEVLSHYGLRPDRNGMLHCPFHPDRTPSMQVYPKTDTVYCFSSNCPTQGKSLDVIDFILHKEQCDKSEAIRKAKELAGESQSGKTKTVALKAGQAPSVSVARIAVLSKVLHESGSILKRSRKAQSYCRERGLDWTWGGMGYLEAHYHRSWNNQLKQSGIEIGLLKELPNGTLSPVFRNCLLFGMKNKEGKTVNLYGRSLEGKNHYYLKGRHQGLYPKYPEAGTQKLILTESLIDAATLVQHVESKEYGVLACYGTNGFTEEHSEAVSRLQELQEVILFFDGDEAGSKGAAKIAEKLSGITQAKISQVPTPEGEDVNSLLQSHPGEPGQAPEIFAHLLNQRTPCLPDRQAFSSRPSVRDVPFSTEIEQVEKEQKASLPSAPDTVQSPDSLDTRNLNKIRYETESLLIEIWGGIEKHHLHRLKLSLFLENKANQLSFRDDVNLYSHRSFKQFLQDAGEDLEMAQSDLKEILQAFTRAVEAYRLEEKEKSEKSNRPAKVILNQLEQEEALKRLRDKNLVKNLRLAMQKTGLIGETDNGLLLFLIFLTRFFETPLHALVHGSSGSGKTNLLKTILQLVPEESKYETTALSENVLFRPPYKSFWKNKILLLEDLDGSYKALLPLREFMTAQKISKFISEHDPKTGAFKQVHLQAEGPVCIAGATTKDKVYEDNANRSFLIHVNESKAHQQAVLDYQNKKAAGLIDSEGIEQTTRKIHNIQRMLNPNVKVINPFQPFLKLPEYVFKKLRTNTHYITLIQAVTFLHQYRREVRQTETGLKYVETTLEDVELANLLSKESLLRKSDELSGAVREFFEALKYTVRQTKKETFTAKEIREKFRMHPMQLKRRLDELCNRGYIKITGGNRRISYEYEITTWDDYNILQDALQLMDDILADLWQKYPDGKFTDRKVGM